MLNFKRFFIFLLFTLLTLGPGAESEDFSSGAEYLHTAIRDIVLKNSERNILNLIDSQPMMPTKSPARRVAPSNSLLFDVNRRFSGGEHQHPHPDPHQDYLLPPDPPHEVPQVSPSAHGVPSPPSLTKGELAALYEAAVSAGHAVHMTAPGLQDSVPVQAALHEIRDTEQHHQQHHQQLGSATDGYYYYYYPLKSFLDGVPAHVPKPTHSTHVPKDHYKTPVLTSYNTHLHNVKVEPLHPPEVPKGGKALEPLFMAISSFVGMAVMFLFSMVLWPRLSGGVKVGVKGGGKNNNKKKKARLLQDLHVDWPSVVRRLVEAYSCKTCRNDGRLAPYRTALSRTGRAKFNK